MNCKDVEKLMVAFLDGEATGKEQDLIGEHITTCQSCREEMEAMATTQNNLRQALESRAAKYSQSPDAWQRLRQQITMKEPLEVTKQGLVGSLLKAMKSIDIGSLFSRRPSWKTGLVGIVALALVVSLAVVLPPLFEKSNEVLAKEIALNNPEVQALLGDKELEENDVEVIDNIDVNGHSSVFIRVKPDYVVIADINMKTKEVVVIEVEIVALTEEKKQEIIDIAKTDPTVKTLLDQGAYISLFQISYAPPDVVGGGLFNPPAGVGAIAPLVVQDQEVISEDLVEFFAQFWMELNGIEYCVFIDMPARNVFSLANLNYPDTTGVTVLPPDAPLPTTLPPTLSLP